MTQASTIARAGSCGVETILSTRTTPARARIISVNVPPVSIPTSASLMIEAGRLKDLKITGERYGTLPTSQRWRPIFKNVGSQVKRAEDPPCLPLCAAASPAPEPGFAQRFQAPALCYAQREAAAQAKRPTRNTRRQASSWGRKLSMSVESARVSAHPRVLALFTRPDLRPRCASRPLFSKARSRQRAKD